MEALDILTVGVREWPTYFKVPRLWRASALLGAYYLFRFHSYDIWSQIHKLSRPSEDFRFGETPYNVGLELLKMAQVTERDVLYDLGAGRGKMVLLAALATKCRAVGLEYLPSYAIVAQRVIRALGLEPWADLHQADILQADLGEATVLFSAASSWAASTKEQLLRRVPTLAPGTRWISVGWELRHPLLELRAARRLLFSWGYDNAWYYVVKAETGEAEDAAADNGAETLHPEDAVAAI